MFSKLNIPDAKLNTHFVSITSIPPSGSLLLLLFCLCAHHRSLEQSHRAVLGTVTWRFSRGESRRSFAGPAWTVAWSLAGSAMATSLGQLGSHALLGTGCQQRSGLIRNGPPYAPGVIGVMGAVTFAEDSRGARLNLRDRETVIIDGLWRRLERYPPGCGIAEAESRERNQEYATAFPSDRDLSPALLGLQDNISFGLYAVRCDEGCFGLHPLDFSVLLMKFTRHGVRD